MLLKFVYKSRVLQKYANNHSKSTLINFYRNNSTDTCTMAKKALVFLAPGAEEMEFVISVDVLRRGGVSTKTNEL